MTAQSPITGYLTPEDVARARELWSKGGRVNKIMAEVSAVTGVCMDDLRGSSRLPLIVKARQLVWFAAHRDGVPYLEIARATGHSRSSVVLGVSREAKARGQA